MTFYDAVGRIGYVGDGSSGDQSIYLNSDFGDVVLRNASVNTLTATSGGNVGIGTTAPSFKLHVNGETRTDMLSVGTYVGGIGVIGLCTTASGVNANRVTYRFWYPD